MLIQGWPRGIDTSCIDQSTGNKLAGEGYNLCSMASVFLPLVYRSRIPTLWTCLPCIETVPVALSRGVTLAQHEQEKN
jgi:hypothetical protein